MSSSHHQRQRHGVKKNLVEGIGGFLTGAALVLLLRGITQRRAASKPTNDQIDPIESPASGDPA